MINFIVNFEVPSSYAFVNASLDIRLPIYTCISYLLCIYFLRMYTRRSLGDNPLWVNQYFTIVHNTFIAFISLLLCISSILVMLYYTYNGGIYSLYCDSQNDGRGPIYFLLWVYYLSKYYELIDTFIIILKNGELIFLHYYHHCIIIPVTWAWVVFHMRFGIIGVCANAAVHVIMYAYYAISTIKTPLFISLARFWRSKITIIQIFQFILSFILSIPYLLFASDNCHGGDHKAFIISFIMNASFLFLFCKFYINKRMGA